MKTDTLLINKWEEITVKSDIIPKLGKNGRVVLNKRYLKKDSTGQPSETPEDLFSRVARYIAAADFKYTDSSEEVNDTATKFYNRMAQMEFLPNSPTLMNAGRPLGQLSACFVIPVEDSMDKIFDAVKQMALIHKSGGGTGFSFSRLRPKNDFVHTTAGISSGPVSFMNIFNSATETIKQGGTRRGANMAILTIDHPDILDFITAKEDGEALTNFNISVALTDSFMKALEKGEDYTLLNPNTGETAGTLNSQKVFDLIVEKAWKNGEPGIIFLDRINAQNPLKDIGTIESTNPCGEQPLLPFESCNLGSINLNAIVNEEGDKPYIDYSLLKDITADAVHFLDNVIEMNKYPLPEIEEMTMANRKIGLGVMGFADLLIKTGIPYNSETAIETAETIMKIIQEESQRVSQKLAETRGPFPNYQKSAYARNDEAPLRNATTTTIAPTGTISIIAGSSSGIEPVFALAYVRNVMDNQQLVESNPLFEKIMKDEGLFSEEVMMEVAEHGTVTDIDSIPDHIKNIFVTAHDISPEWHIRLQGAFQKYTDNAVSKTVNFPNNATIQEVEQVYRLAYSLGCKGVTVYRDGSRDEQVLATKKSREQTNNSKKENVKEGHTSIRPRPRNEMIWGSTRKMQTGCGSLYVTINEDEDGLFEVFAVMGKSGGCAASQTEAISRLISLSLRSGIDRQQIIKQIKGVRCPNQTWGKGGRVYSCADAIAKAIERHIGIEQAAVSRQISPSEIAETNGKGSDSVMVGVCPECHGPLEFASGCSHCRSCGFSRCG